MGFESTVESLRETGVPGALRQFGRVLDASWVESALRESGTATVRRRRLPAETVVWLVIAMALFRDCAIKTVVTHLALALPSKRRVKGKPAASVAGSAVAQSRERLGDEPVRLIFDRSGETWTDAAAGADRWRGLSLYGMDGSTLNVADTDENEEAFGRPGSSRGRAGYPQLRLVVLMALRTHLLRAAAIGRYKGKETSEQALARDLWPKIPERSLTIVDKGFLNYGAFWRLHHDESGAPTSRHWLTRAKSNLRWKTVAVLNDGSELVEVSIGHQARKNFPGAPRTMRLRALTYQVDGWPVRRLLTSLLDPDTYPAEEIAALYHERWEIELGYAELKTHMLERKEALRSRKPNGVRQEVWGILLAYNLVRLKMAEAAEEAGLPPTRMSFKLSLQLIQIFAGANAWTAPAGTMATQLQMLREMLSVLILPERRPERRYKRHVKVKMSNYKRNPGRPPTARNQKKDEPK